jgi:uncharacterized protein (DUF1810 family)
LAEDAFDPFNLRRFVDAQADAFARVESELRAGQKRSHWMWYIFPQFSGLGHSAMSQLYAIGSLEEARAYLAHPLLGARLRACVRALCAVEGRSLHDILGAPDDAKFRSCMTLFTQAAPDERAFGDALTKFCNGEADPATMDLLAKRRKSV